MSQTFLDENPPMILDATCSFRNAKKGYNWPKHATIRMDIRPEVKPQLVGDATKTDFADQSIDEEYLDPPHLVHVPSESAKRLRRTKYHRLDPDYFTRYGWWHNRKEWLGFAEGSLKEARRILKPTGILHFKLTECKDGKIRVTDITSSPLFELIEHRTSKAKGGFGSEKSVVHWLTMRPKP